MTLEDFYRDIQAKQIDASKLTAFVDNNRFFVMDVQGKQIVSGYEHDIVELFFKLLGIAVEDI